MNTDVNDGVAISVDELCAAMNAASAQILDSYRTWIAHDPEDKPRYGQIPRYDQLNDAITRLEIFGLSALAEKDARIAELEAEFIQSRNFWSDELSASRAECEGLRATLERAVEIVRQHVPYIPPDGPTSSEHQAAYEAVGFAFQALERHVRAALSQKETGA